MHPQHTTTLLSRRTVLGAAITAAGAATLAVTPANASAARRRGAAPEPSQPLSFVLLPTPVRAYDSRHGQPPEGTDPNTGAGDLPLLRGVTRKIDISYVLGSAAAPTLVPETARGVLLNLTCVNTTGTSGYLKVWQWDAAEPLASSINWDRPGSVLANSVTSGCAGGYIHVKCGGPVGASTDFIVDIVGYYDEIFPGP